tara:strand:+ start:2372 stop:3652 length:1281 start_codon:yes stop_codon:yes gene_type:complete
MINFYDFKRYLFNTNWLMIEHVFRAAATLLISILLARYLGPIQFGTFNFIIAIYSIIHALSKLGLDGILVRDFVNNEEKEKNILSTSFWLKVSFSIFIIITVAIVFMLSNRDSINYSYLMIMSCVLIFQSFDVIQFYLEAKVLGKVIAICKFVQVAISTALKIFLIYIEANLYFFFIVFVIDALVISIAYLSVLNRNAFSLFPKYFRINIAKKLISDSFPLIISALAVIVYMRIDQIMLNYFFGSYEVGIYSISIKLSEALYFIPIIITTSVFPLLIAAKRKSLTSYMQSTQILYTALVWLAIFITTFIFFSSDLIVNLLFGDIYAESARVLKIHALSMVFVFIGVASEKYLINENLTTISLKRTLTGAISNIVLNIFLIPKMGVIGAAIATLISQFIANFMYDLFDKRLHNQLKLKVKAFLFYVK